VIKTIRIVVEAEQALNAEKRPQTAAGTV